MPETITELQNLWSAINKNLRENVEDVRFFDVFLAESYIHSFEGNKMIVAVNSNLAANLLSTKYLNVVQDSVKSVTGKNVSVTFDIADNLKSAAPVEEKPLYFRNSLVNPNLVFDNFVTGPSNIEAKQAAVYIASNPGAGFNPLFIYSNPGLGKTHLLHGIANSIRANFPGKRALYFGALDFLQEVVDTAQGKKEIEALKKFVCNHDVLLIDDVQMLSGKDITLAFFFDIFNKMLLSGKQVVITCDKAPSEIKGFDERLRSRFDSGLTVTIGQPEVPTCVAILKSKIENSPLPLDSIDPRVLDFVGEKFSKNIREIDSALNRLIWYVTIYKPTKFIDMQTAMEALQNLIDVKDAKTKLSEQKIINVVAEYYNCTPSELTGPSRASKVSLPRHVAMYLIRMMLDVPFTKIGYIFGGKDHSTVMSGVNKVEKSLKTSINLQTAVNDIKSKLKS